MKMVKSLLLIEGAGLGIKIEGWNINPGGGTGGIDPGGGEGLSIEGNGG